MSNFQVGQKVVRQQKRKYDYVLKKYVWSYGGAFKIHIIENGYLYDVYLNKFPENECVDEASYNSPLWKAMKEET